MNHATTVHLVRGIGWVVSCACGYWQDAVSEDGARRLASDHTTIWTKVRNP